MKAFKHAKPFIREIWGFILKDCLDRENDTYHISEDKIKKELSWVGEVGDFFYSDGQIKEAIAYIVSVGAAIRKDDKLVLNGFKTLLNGYYDKPRKQERILEGYDGEKDVIRKVWHLFEEALKPKGAGINSWLIEVNKIHRLDKLTYQEIIDIITWAREDTSFWRDNLRSLNTLRNKGKNKLMKHENIKRSMLQNGFTFTTGKSKWESFNYSTLDVSNKKELNDALAYLRTVDEYFFESNPSAKYIYEKYNC